MVAVTEHIYIIGVYMQNKQIREVCQCKEAGYQSRKTRRQNTPELQNTLLVFES